MFRETICRHRLPVLGLALLLSAPIGAEEFGDPWGPRSGSIEDDRAIADDRLLDDRADPGDDLGFDELIEEAPPPGFDAGEGDRAGVDDRLVSDASVEATAEAVSEPTTEPPFVGPRLPRYRVTSRLAPIFVDGKEIGHLYRWAVFDAGADPAGDRVSVVRLRSGYFPKDRVFDPAPELLERMKAEGGEGPWIPRPPENGNPGSSFLMGGMDFSMRSPALRVRGLIGDDPLLAFLWFPEELQPAGEQTPHVAVTPRGAEVALDDLQLIDPDALEPANRRYESNRSEILYIGVAGTEPSPVYTELEPDGPAIGNLRKLDYESGIAREMAYFEELRPSRRLHVFVDASAKIAHEHRYLPVPERQNWGYRTFDVSLMDGSAEQLTEPHPVIVFPEREVMDFPDSSLLEIYKHELGHVIQDLKAPIYSKGYASSFGAHNLPVRSNDRSAFVEGFAEYTAFKFRDSDRETSRDELRDLLQRNNRRAYENLLWFYWIAFKERSVISSRLTKETLQEAESKLFTFWWTPSERPPSPEQFQRTMADLLAGKGEPPLARADIEREIRELNVANPEGIANVADEELTADEVAELREAGRDLYRSIFGSGERPTFFQSLSRLSDLTLRSAQDIFMNEGAIALLMLRLDEELSREGIDFYAKVLSALDDDPYAGQSRPQQPVNFKELIAVLERDPELQGRLVPILSTATGARLQARDFVLYETREADPLSTASPGLRVASSGGSVGASDPATGSVDLGDPTTGSAGGGALGDGQGGGEGTAGLGGAGGSDEETLPSFEDLVAQ